MSIQEINVQQTMDIPEEYPITYPDLVGVSVAEVPLWIAPVIPAAPIKNVEPINIAQVEEQPPVEKKLLEEVAYTTKSKFNLKNSCKKAINIFSKKAQTAQEKISIKWPTINPFTKKNQNRIPEVQAEPEETLKVEDFMKEINIDSLSFDQKIDKCREILSSLKDQNDPLFLLILQSTMLDFLISEKGNEYKKYFDAFRGLPQDFLDVTRQWGLLINESLFLYVEEKAEEQIYSLQKCMLIKLFGSQENVSKDMDNFLNQYHSIEQVTLEDYIAKGAVITKWKTLAWVYNFISSEPLPFDPENTRQFINPSLNFTPFVPPLELEGEVEGEIEEASTQQESELPLPDVKQEEEVPTVCIETEMMHAEKKIETVALVKEVKEAPKPQKPMISNSLVRARPVKYEIKESIHWYKEIPPSIMYHIFDNIFHGIIGKAEEKVFNYAIHKYNKKTPVWERDISKLISHLHEHYRIEAMKAEEKAKKSF